MDSRSECLDIEFEKRYFNTLIPFRRADFTYKIGLLRYLRGMSQYLQMLLLLVFFRVVLLALCCSLVAC